MYCGNMVRTKFSSTHATNSKAARYERDKTKRAHDIMTTNQIVRDFHAFGLDTYGAMGPSATAFLAMLAEHAQQFEVRRSCAANWAAPRFMDVARQYISVALHGAIARQLRNFATDKRRRGGRAQAAMRTASPTRRSTTRPHT